MCCANIVDPYVHLIDFVTRKGGKRKIEKNQQQQIANWLLEPFSILNMPLVDTVYSRSLTEKRNNNRHTMNILLL